MPKMRGIKPETWTDDKIVELSPLARLLFIGMWNYACDNGHIQNKPAQLKMRILPADDCDVKVLVKELVKVGCVTEAGGYLTIPTLPTHQRIDRRYFTSCDHCAPAEIPSKPDGHTTSTRSEPTGNTSGSRVEGRKEGTEGEGDGESAPAGKPAKRATSLPKDFRPTDGHMTLAREIGIDLRAEWPRFCDHHTAKGSTFKDWDAALRNWIRGATKFGGNVRPLTPRASEPDDQGRIVLPPLPKGVFEQ